MAEIKIEKKSNPWPWIIGLIILALLAWAAFAAFNDRDRAGDTAYAGNETRAVAASGAYDDNAAANNAATRDAGAPRLYFPLDQAELTAENRNALDRIAAEVRADPDAEIVLAAYTDTTGTRPYNQALAERRGAAVRQYLVDQGIADGRITVEAHGQSDPLVETGDNVRESDNRRVRIEFGDEP